MKQFRRFMVALVLAALLLGCMPIGALAEAKLPVELYVIDWNPQQQALWEGVFAQFMQEYPNVTITYDIVPFAQYWTKLESAISTGSGADILCMNPINVERFARNNSLLPLNDLIERDGFDMSVFEDTYKNHWKIDGEFYALPKDVDGFAVLYNRKIFDEAGVPYPAPGWTWADFRQTAWALANPEKGIYGVSYDYSDLKACVYPIIFANGGYILSEDKRTCGYDDPRTIEAIQFIYDMVNQPHAAPSLLQILDMNAADTFMAGIAGMEIQGSFRLMDYLWNENVQGDVDVAPMPVGVTRHNTANGVSWAISSTTKAPDEAWELLKMMCGEVGAEAQGRNGAIIPANKELRYLYTENDDVNRAAFIDRLEEGIFQPITINMGDWRSIETQYIQMIFEGEISVEEGCLALAEEMNAVLAQQ